VHWLTDVKTDDGSGQRSYVASQVQLEPSVQHHVSCHDVIPVVRVPSEQSAPVDVVVQENGSHEHVAECRGHPSSAQHKPGATIADVHCPPPAVPSNEQKHESAVALQLGCMLPPVPESAAEDAVQTAHWVLIHDDRSLTKADSSSQAVAFEPPTQSSR
jgi:hypothetical protein